MGMHRMHHATLRDVCAPIVIGYVAEFYNNKDRT